MTSSEHNQNLAQRVIFRFDANSKMGVGHAMRCLALIEAFINREAEVILAYAELPDYLLTTAVNVGAKLHHLKGANQAQQITDLYDAYRAGFIVIDGYHFDENLLKALQQTGVKTVYFDDINSRDQITANAIINACPDADDLGYERTSVRAHHLLGLDFAMINPSLKQISQPKFNERKAITICFGGSDVKGLTKKLLDSLSTQARLLSNFQVQVVTGKLVQELDVIAERCHSLGFHHYIQPDNFSELLSHSAIAIAAPGNLVYELAYFNVPSILITVADNQQVSANFHQNKGWAEAVDGHSDDALALTLEKLSVLIETPKKLQAMHRASIDLIDGKGASRLAEKILSLSASGAL